MNWWTTFVDDIAKAIGWTTTAIEANGCTGPNEYFDASTGQCLTAPTCPNGIINTSTMPWSCYTPEQNNSWIWMLIIGALIFMVVIILLVTRRK